MNQAAKDKIEVVEPDEPITDRVVSIDRNALILLYNAVSKAQNDGFYTSLSFEEQISILGTLINIRPTLAAAAPQTNHA